MLIPENLSIKNEKNVTARALAERVPQKHKDFVHDLLARHGVEVSQAGEPGGLRAGNRSHLQLQLGLRPGRRTEANRRPSAAHRGRVAAAER